MNNYKNKIYITGVSGFIGSSIAKLLLSKDYKVIGITRKLSPAVKKELDIDVIESNLNDISSLELDTAHTLIHCATANDILSKDVIAGFSLSVVGTVKILEASKRAGIQNVIFFSTAQVYGTELNGYFDEFSQINCETPYAMNHYLGEELCKFYSQKNYLNITILRPSNVYGVPEISTVNRKTLVPMCFVGDAINHGLITLHSSGRQKRNFISTDELTQIVYKTIENFPKGYFIKNCGSNLTVSMLDIIKIVSKKYQIHYNKKLKIISESNKPEFSNNFDYNSKLIEYQNSEKESLDLLENVIEILFQA